jgi:phosphatidylserine decarboxylase
MIAPGGYKIIIITTIIFLGSTLLTYYYPNLIFKIITLSLAIFFLFNFFFFRDPKRIIPKGDQLIVSPGDGKVVQIERVMEPEYFKSEVQRLSIFLSVFDVHVNRAPIAGKVDYFRYIPGKFLLAFKPMSSELNEQTVIGIQNGEKRILFKQIAGIIARRIVCEIGEGDTVSAGSRFGLIRYGSRIDVFYPDNAEISVKIGDHVYGGETIIGEFK